MKISFYVSLLVLATFTLPAMAEEPKKTSNTTISGVAEVEAGFSDGNSDISLATVEVGIDHSMGEKAEAHLLFLYQEGENDDNIAVDEATITLHPHKNISITAGRMYVPFGQFDSNMLSDPLTLELGESQEEALQFGLSSGHFSSSFYLFKDDADGSEKIDDYGLTVGYETDAFSTGASYITDVNDQSDSTHSAKGFSVHAKGTIGRATLIAEQLNVNKIANGKKPQATHLELGIDLGAERMLAFSLNKTKNANALDLPKNASGIAYSMPLYDNVGLTAEVMKTKAYDNSTDTTTTVQLSYEF
ncbi:MAG: LbtU family siderophore porin [Cocleimonas sp.]|nr:LbtU family siderophore porin [Cocleimonas sp.]